MGLPLNGYYYNRQLKKYVIQFMAVFTGLQVQVGKSATQNERLIEVPIRYGHPDRVVSSIIARNTQNAPLRLPLMSAYCRNIELDMSRAKGVSVERRNAYVPLGGLVPDDIQVVKQRMPVPYNLTMELTMLCSNQDQEFQILEQLLPIFDPALSIQTSDSPFDWSKITHVELISMGNESNYPTGGNQRLIQRTMTFMLPVWIEVPADIRREIVEQIFVRIGEVDDTVVTNYEILEDLDGQGLEYETWLDASNVEI